jgi:hypothetical protein
MRILEKQQYHLVSLIILVSGVFFIARGDFLQGSFAGLSTKTWLKLSVLAPVVHQIYVVILWRAELYYQYLSTWFGKRAFGVWTAGFMILFLVRPIFIFGLAIANRGTLALPNFLGIVLSVLCILPAIYLIYSVLKYFGLKRALGMDHFQPQIYQSLPLVNQGIFRWTPNAMYLFGFLFLWIPGFLFLSKSGLLVALFSHLYIWVHYYFTEYPDMHYIYQSD